MKCVFLLSSLLTCSRFPVVCMVLLSVAWWGSEKAPEALPTALDAESRNRSPQKQRLLMARLASASPGRPPWAASERLSFLKGLLAA